jgi:CRP/FNR family cyclic AMP-dependent transcriptional regulator
MNLIEKLRSIAIFEHFEDATLEQLSQSLEVREFGRQEMIFKQNDPGAELFIIDEGCVQIFRVETDEIDYLRPDGDEKELCRLNPGDYFGEIAVLGGEKRSASARALTPTKTWVLRRERFQALIVQSPKMALEICRGLASYLNRTSAKSLDLRRLC